MPKPLPIYPSSMSYIQSLLEKILGLSIVSHIQKHLKSKLIHDRNMFCMKDILCNLAGPLHGSRVN